MSYYYRKSRAVRGIESIVNDGLLTPKWYRGLKNTLTSGRASLDELNKVTRNNVYKKVFYYKFIQSCHCARYNRCKKKKGYENIEYLLGDKQGLIWRLNRQRPDLVKQGISICQKYVESGFDYSFAPVLHRKDNSKHYEWTNIEIMSRSDHDLLKVKEKREQPKEVSASL